MFEVAGSFIVKTRSFEPLESALSKGMSAAKEENAEDVQQKSISKVKPLKTDEVIKFRLRYRLPAGPLCWDKCGHSRDKIPPIHG